MTSILRTRQERIELIEAWLELVGLTDEERIPVAAEWTLASLDSTAILGPSLPALRESEVTWRFALEAVEQHVEYDMEALTIAIPAIDATIELAYQLYRVAPVRRRIRELNVTAEQFLFDLGVAVIARRRNAIPMTPDSE
jgi:hypothetical protein